MLLYSTLLEMNETMTKDDFIQLVIEWNQSHSHEENIIKGLSWDGEERNVRFGNEKLWLEIIEYRNENIIAVRYEKVADDGAIWDTDYIMNFNDMRLSIRLDRSYLEEAVIENGYFSSPQFVDYIVKKNYVKPDGMIEVSLESVEISSDNIDLLTGIISGKGEYRLPIVYVSKTVYNTNPLDVEKLCKRLKGVAHVLVQKDRDINDYIFATYPDANEINGAVGIYYPNDTLGPRTHIVKGKHNKLLSQVVDKVLEYGTLRRIDKLFTWQGVSNSLLYDRLSSQRSERQEAERALEKAETELDNAEIARQVAEKEAEDVYGIVDEELEKLKRQVEELSRANDIKELENQGLRAKLAQVNETPILIQGDEEEMFPGEIKDMVLSVIDEKVTSENKKCRKYHVLLDVLSKNGYEKLSDKKKNEIKNLFKGYDRMTGSLRNDLQRLGFSISEDGKHYKLLYNNDPRYTITISKTPSDSRSGTNSAGDICRICF